MDDDVSVRVAVRIRPQIPREVIDMCRVCTEVMPGEPQITLGTDKAFTYDYVFDMHENQETIYDVCIANLINGALAGYNATVLAYGQTGSGKTYTMGTGFDVDLSADQTGIIPRAIKHLFNGIEKQIKTSHENASMPPEFKIVAQFMELYNEEIIDLFNPLGENFLKGKYKIHEDPAGGINIKGVTMRPVTSAEEALQCLRLGALSRTTASTQMNTQSSRSHAIFTLHIKQQRLVSIDNEMEDSREMNNIDATSEFETLTAKFHFVDLAGSERLKRTGATGDRAKEGISINCGLLALGNVISALGDVSKKALHVPYRDSKLTRLLQDSLGGNSQTVMIACISPSDRDFMETLNTLKYANRARNIKNKIMINQDKSSRTISMLKQQIQQLQLELIEYRQGKRIIGEDGTEQINDMFYENNMLQGELTNLRTRVKAMQDTINSLSAKNTALLAEKVAGNWTANEGNTDVKDMVTSYLEEIENLRAQLMEATYTCAQLRKAAANAQDSLKQNFIMSNSMSFIGNPLGETPSLIEEAKRELQKEKELLFKRSKSDEESEEEKESESESESDSEKVDDGLQAELMSLTTDIDMKEKLITELELSQQRLHTMRQHYEEKLLQLQARIKDTQEERDKVLQSFSGQHQAPTEKVKKIKDDYERKLLEMQKELKRLQVAKKEHARLLKNQSHHEMQLKSLKNELSDMKRAKVKLINKMKEESQKHKEAELKRTREIAQLRKESRKNANVIRAMETEKRVKEQVLKRKHEEVLALRRENRKGFSRKVAGRVVSNKFSEKQAKQRWISVEKIINKAAMTKQGLVEQELKMEQLLEKREVLGKDLDKYVQKRNVLLQSNQDVTEITSFIDDLKAHINYVQESINDTQHNVMEIEEQQESSDNQNFINNVYDIEEAKYLIQKLFNMTINQSYTVAQRDAKLKENEATLNEVKQDIYVKSQLLDHVLHTDQELYDKNNMLTSISSNISESDASSNNSSRSSTPTDNNLQGFNSNVHQNNKNKIRRKTVNPADMLFGSNNDDDSQIMTQSQGGSPRTLQPIVRVPSAPGSLKGLIPLRVNTNTQELISQRDVKKTSTNLLSPRPSHRIPLSVQSTKHGSMEQGLDWNAAGSSGSPVSYRKMTSREDNVFSRLTSSTAQVEPNSVSGNITPYTGKSLLKGSLQCVAVAEGHSSGVLSLCTTNELMFTGAADRTVKVWDLLTRTEIQTLHGHPNNVVAVRYNEQSRILLSASTYLLKVWDLRMSTSQCIKVLCSSGMTQNSTSFATAVSNRTAQMPVGESQINDVLFNSTGSLICSAASDKVRVWDVRKFTCVGKLSGGHQAAVMCLAFENYDASSDLVVTGSKDHYIKVYNMSMTGSGNIGPSMNLEPPHYDGIQSLVVADSILFSGSRDMCIKKWDLKEGELVQSLNNAHKGWVCGMALYKNNGLLLSGCRTGNMKLWDAKTCDQLANIRAHNSAINSITTSSQNIFTASNCGEVKIWKLADC